eukprot:TRINITY_DN20183_c0_g1_i1.p3 TRINITY_DN20183_c0_g1~~TRINITY_DN20183_c0_g1_i1.p3  ORF type:complete len:146 (+),score=28.19 TRINITY_DN20183_c0_g1_i1:96-533(+)
MAALINDVSTDLQDPPKFTQAKIGDLPENFKPQIQQLYSDLKPLEIKIQDDKPIFDAVLSACEKMPRWKIVVSNRDLGIVEGVATTFLLRFKDDFVIRIKSVSKGDDESVAVVDMRSRSRLGKSDLGANYKRIMKFQQVLKQIYL